MSNVKMHNYVKDNEECKAVITTALKETYDLNIHDPSYSDFANPLRQPRLPYAVFFAIGGWSEGSPINTTETHDALADQWVNVTSEEERLPAYRSPDYLKGFSYIMGGFDSIGYFSGNKQLDTLKKTQQQPEPLHLRRCYVRASILNDFICAKGKFDGYTHLSTAERGKSETNQWTRTALVHKRRSNASVTKLHEKIDRW